MSNAFEQARGIEAQALAVLIPFFRESAHEGQFVMTSKGPLARHIQETMGDAMFNENAETLWTVEIKAEAENKYGNFFLETWSNRNLEARADHARHGSNPGWMQKLRADLLFYYFISSDELYIVNLFKLQRWAFHHHNNGAPRIDAFPERPQGKYAQANDTWGRCVPIHVIEREVGFRKVFPKQVELFSEAA